MDEKKQIDYKEFARQMRQVATVFNGTELAVVCSKELWEYIASMVESFAGYRRQEWISVEERMPEVGDTYLIALKEKYEWEKEWRYHVDVASFTFEWDCIFNDWDEGQEIHITHWMPLPEAPKTKGGAE